MLQRLQELIFSLKEKISDGEYLDLMNELKKVHEKTQNFEESSDEEGEIAVQPIVNPASSNGCNCVEGNVERPCFKDAETLLQCRFQVEFFQAYPLSRHALVCSGVLNHNFAVTEAPSLCFEKIVGDYDWRKLTDNVNVLVFLVTKIRGNQNKLYHFIQIFDFVFRNYRFVEENEGFRQTIGQKLIELDEQFEPIPLFPENPFTRWRAIF